MTRLNTAKISYFAKSLKPDHIDPISSHIYKIWKKFPKLVIFFKNDHYYALILRYFDAGAK